MKQLLPPANATFDFTAKTITFATTIPSTISHILHVTNVTRGVLYFQPQGGSALTGTYASPVLTLLCSTAGHADADKLEIFYDDALVTQASTQSGTWTVQPGNTANTTAWKVDGSAVTQPVSGTLTTTPPANASTNVAQVAGTTADVNSGNKSAGTLRVILATDQPALTNKLLVTPDSVALPANQSTNVAQVAGTATDVNSGLKSAGTMRVILATDQPQLTAKLLVTPDSVALPANQSVNTAQINGVTTLMGNGVTGTGSQRVTIASDNTAFAVNSTLTAETTKVIGTVNVAGSQTIAVTQATGTNLHAVLDATSTTAVTQATGTNLHAVLDANSGVDIGKLTANQSVNVAQVNGVATSTGTGVMGTGVQRVAIASDNDAITVKQATGTNLHAVLDAGAAVVGKVGIDQTTPGTTNLVALAANQSVNVAQINGVTALMGNGATGTGSQRVTIASDNTAFHTIIDSGSTTAVTGTVTTKETRAATPTQTSVGNSTGNVTVVASNANRLGCTIFNDDTAGTGATLKLKLGTTASATSFTIAMAPQSYYEVPFSYTGIIDGIASAATGNARVTELTA